MKRFLLALVVLLMGSWALGDGAVFHSEPKLASPTIPFQRAFLRLENGVQTMVVASTAQVSGTTNLVWVLPLPSPPTEMKPVRNNFFEPLEELTEPEFHRQPGPDDLSRIAVSCGILALALLIAPFAAAHSDRPKLAFLNVTGAGLAVALMFWFWVPTGSPTEAATTAGGSVSAPEVDVLQSAEVGNYHVEVVRGEKDGVTNWMKRNSFQLPGQAAKVVGEYVEDGWVFLMVRLRSEGSGFLTPHPLAVTFASKELTYPMRLTGAMDAPVAVELFVAAPGHAVSSHLKTLKAAPVVDAQPMAWQANRKSPAIGNVTHADLAPLLRRSDLVTRLRAVAMPSDMTTDWRVEIRPGYPGSIRLDTTESAFFKAARLAMFTGLGSLFLACLVLIWREMNPLWTVVVLLLAGCIGFGAGYLQLKSNPGFLAMSLSGESAAQIDDWIWNVLFDLDRPNMATLAKMGAKKYIVTQHGLEDVVHTGSAATLGDNRIGVFPYEKGVRVIVQTNQGARYEFDYPGIKP